MSARARAATCAPLTAPGVACDALVAHECHGTFSAAVVTLNSTVGAM